MKGLAMNLSLLKNWLIRGNSLNCSLVLYMFVFFCRSCQKCDFLHVRMPLCSAAVFHFVSLFSFVLVVL